MVKRHPRRAAALGRFDSWARGTIRATAACGLALACVLAMFPRASAEIHGPEISAIQFPRVIPANRVYFHGTVQFTAGTNDPKRYVVWMDVETIQAPPEGWIFRDDSGAIRGQTTGAFSFSLLCREPGVMRLGFTLTDSMFRTSPRTVRTFTCD